MKTKTLIALLQKADPSGEEECCVGNIDILDVWIEPAYWDGCLQVLKRDENSKGYSVIGAKITSKGKKVVIDTHSIKSAIWNRISAGYKLDIEYDDYSNPHYKAIYDGEIEKAENYIKSKHKGNKV